MSAPSNGGAIQRASEPYVNFVLDALDEHNSKSLEEIAEAIQHGAPRKALRHGHIHAMLHHLYKQGRVAKHWPSGEVGVGECRWLK